MATNPFGFGPMGLPSKAPEEPAAKKARIDSLAIKTSVPANVLLALEERGENVETRASDIVANRGRKRLEEVIDPETMGRAYDIADALYPRVLNLAQPQRNRNPVLPVICGASSPARLCGHRWHGRCLLVPRPISTPMAA